VLTYALAVLAAGANAISSVPQRKANKRVPQRENLSLRQIWILLHQPVWFGGIVAITAGFLLQASALGSGQLAVVEPVLVLELPFTLILASRLFRQRLGPREWLPAFAMTAGLAGLVYLLAPSAGGSPRVHWYGWLAGIGGNLALVGVLVLWARRGSIRRSRGKDTAQPGGSFRAAVLSVAAGSTFGPKTVPPEANSQPEPRARRDTAVACRTGSVRAARRAACSAPGRLRPARR
jgi:drug/metabolite transporter (DMT)-like permease